MKKYASDHKGRYPERLELLVPGYLKELPPFTSPLSDEDRRFYEEKYKVLLHYDYKVDNTVPAYTVTCGIDRGCMERKQGERFHGTRLRYDSIMGLYDH